jgi:hypothetical protein
MDWRRRGSYRETLRAARSVNACSLELNRLDKSTGVGWEILYVVDAPFFVDGGKR